MKNWILLLATVFSLGCANMQTEMREEYRIAFYNVENLYDTINNPNTHDDDFLPEAETHWNTERYNLKIDHLAEVIQSLGKDGELPVLIGLCEVENKVVLGDLSSHTNILEAGYEYIHEESPDERGSDVALMFRKGLFKEISHKALLVIPGGDDRTRDILYVEGNMAGQTVHVFVNHWPSRREGREESEPRRIEAAKVLRKAVDAIIADDPEARIIIMGDFNDEPGNKSIKKVLDAGIPGNERTESSLFNLSFKAFSRGEGTYFYRYEEDWNMLDQMIVSSSMVDDKSGLHCPDKGVNIHREDFIMYRMKGHEAIPNRTYGGRKYFGGYSDHLPVYIDLNAGTDY